MKNFEIFGYKLDNDIMPEFWFDQRTYLVTRNDNNLDQITSVEHFSELSHITTRSTLREPYFPQDRNVLLISSEHFDKFDNQDLFIKSRIAHLIEKGSLLRNRQQIVALFREHLKGTKYLEDLEFSNPELFI